MVILRQHSEIITVVRQTGREALTAIADLGEQVDALEGKVDTLTGRVDRLENKVDKGFAVMNEKFDAHAALLHRILKRLGEEE